MILLKPIHRTNLWLWLQRLLVGDLLAADFPWVGPPFELLAVGVFDFDRLPDDEDEDEESGREKRNFWLDIIALFRINLNMNCLN